MFEDDLFISYSHIDNLAVGSGQEGWVTSLHQSLEVRLAQLLGRMPKIWRDPKLQGNDFFSDEISDRFNTVAAMITVMSPRYVRSEWCQKEINGFSAASVATGGIAFQGKGRVFKLIKTPVPLEQHPETLKGLLGYEFYRLDPETERPREFGQNSGPDTERLYWAKLDDLAYDICGLLEAMESPAGAAGGEAPAPATIRERVFLADTSLDLKPARDAVKRDLEQNGFEVLPDRPLPLNAAEFTETVPALLAKSRLSIHLLGGTYGIVPEGADRSIIELQHQFALESSRTDNLERVVWISPGTEAEDPRQRTLLDFLKTDSSAQEKADILETSLEELKLAIHNKLERNGKSEEVVEATEGDLKTIYLICDARDQESTKPLADLLFDKGLEIILPAFEGDEAEVRLDHQENLKMCDAVILYYGTARELWLRAKLRELQKVAGYGRSEPFRSKAIYVAEPTTPQKESLRTREAMIIDGLEGLSISLLEDFLGKLAD